jgi:DNA-binding SARP family transcriptional activator
MPDRMLPSSRTHRSRALSVLLIGALSTWALWRARALPELRIDAADFGRWLDTTDTAQVVVAIVCHLGLVVAGYVTAISALYLLADVTRLDWLRRLARALALPPLRRLLDAALASSIVLGTVAGPVRASPAASVGNPAATAEVVVPASPPSQTFEHVASLGVPASPVTDGASSPVAGLYAPEREHVVAPSEHFWSISRRRLAELFGRGPRNAEIAPYHRQMIERNRERLLERDNPDLILPDQVLIEPAVGTAPVETPPVGGSPDQESRPPDEVEALHSDGAAGEAPGAGAAAPTRPTAVPALRNNGGTPDTDDDRSTPARAWRVTGFLAATALATWVLQEARRRRSRRLRRSRAGQVFPPPDPTVAPTAAAVHANADPPAVGRLDAALRHLANAPCSPAPFPQVVLRHPNGDVEVFLADPVADAPTPWTARANGRVWALDAESTLSVDEGFPPPCPALVQLGTCEDGAELFADLEAFGTLGIDGPPEAVRQIARAVVAMLVVSPNAQLCRILTHGFDSLGLGDDVGRPAVVDSLDTLLDEAEGTSRVVAEAAVRRRVGSSFRLRASSPEEGWEPAIVVVAGGTPTERQDERLAALGGTGGRGVAVVRAASDAPWKLHAVEPAGWWRLDPLGVRMRPVALAEAELRDLAAYLAEADTAPVDVVPASTPARRVDVPPTGGSDYRDRPWLAMVRLLGAVDVVACDGTAPGDPGRALEFLVWLVTHRPTATRARALRALWADREVEARILRNVITGARLLLRNTAGEPPDGAPWIPMGEDHLALHPLVVTDVDLIRDRIAYARRLAPERAASVLAGGLGLLRGVPFEGRRWLWADEEFLSSNVAIEAVAMVTELATLRLKAGDVRGALEATDAGLRVIPLHDQLIELSMQAWITVGDRNAALAVYESYERATAARGEEVAAEIAELRNRLLRAATTD